MADESKTGMSPTEGGKKPCPRCGEPKKLAPNGLACVTCVNNERIKLNEKAERRVAPEKIRAKTRKKVAAYRARKKAAGEVDKSHGQARWLPPKTPPLAPKEEIADKIAAKETAAPLTAQEKRVLTVEEVVHIEMARRELARRNLLPFVLRRNPRYLAGWVHADICARLDKFSEDVAAGLSPRLMLFMPPRHGKSMLCSEEFPAHHLGKYPFHEIIATSFSSPLAFDFSRKVQGIVNSPDFELLFEGCRLQRGAESIEAWRTTERGGYVAAGVGGPITGKGANILIIDDPVKNREEAESATNRKSIKDWYTSTAYTRLMPGGGVLVIQTRWHDDDLSGWLITQMQEAEKQFIATGEWPDDADRWEVVQYPAIATEDEAHRKKGEALHPRRYPLKALLKIKRTIGDRDWGALYQQNPVPETGEYFTKDMLRYYEGPPPAELSVIASGDLAISKADHANYTVLMVAGVDAKDNMYILDAYRGRWDAEQIVDKLIDLQRTHRPSLIGIERTHVEQAIGPFLEKRIREEKLWSMVVEPLPPGKRDKELRARPIQGRMKQGKVFFPKNAAFMEWLTNEALRFPNGVNDDGVDALAWLGQMMNDVQYTPPVKPKLESWKDRLNGLVSGIKQQLGRQAPMAA